MPQDVHPARGWADASTLLCERCGYVIEGLPTGGPCPECGLDIALSLPQRRTGTPWQNRRGLGPLAATGWSVATRPRRTLDRMRIQPPKIAFLLAIAALPIGCLFGAALVLLFERERPLPGGGTVAWSAGSFFGSWMLALVIGVVLTPAVAATLWALTWVEARGLVIFGKQNKFRVPPDLAHTIVRHGAFGWLLCSVGAVLALPLPLTLGLDWEMIFGPPGRLVFLLAFAGFGLALLGFLSFEFFAWLGLRRCRFANRESSHSSSQAVAREG